MIGRPNCLKHILIINQHYYPDFAATGQLLAELCEDLEKAGFKITVITGYPESGTYPENSIPLKNEITGNLTIRRLYNHPAGNKSISNRLLHFFSFWLGSIQASFLTRNVDLVFVMSTPPLLNGITANLLRIFKRIPYIYNVQDLYPAIAVEMGTLKNKPLIRFSEWAEKYINSSAVSIVTLSEPMKMAIADSGVDKNKIQIIPNWSDDQLLKPQKSSSFRSLNHLYGKFVIMYSGNIGMSQGLETILSLAPELEKENPEFHFCIIGNGVKLPALKQQVKNSGVSNVSFHPFQPKELLSDSLNAADIHLIPLTEKMAKYLLPSKLYGILAVGKPILAIVDEGTEIDVLVRNTVCGYSIRPGELGKLKEVLKTAFAERDSLAEMGKKGRSHFLENLTRQKATESYFQLLSRLTSRKQP